MLRIKLEIQNRKLRQVDVADKAGINPGWFSMITNGRVKANREEMKAIKQAIGYPGKMTDLFREVQV